jgi:hypothetical protein
MDPFRDRVVGVSGSGRAVVPACALRTPTTVPNRGDD